jgi:hypothetical protein
MTSAREQGEAERKPCEPRGGRQVRVMLHNPYYVIPARAIHLSPATRRVYIILVMPTLGNTRAGDTFQIPGARVADPYTAARGNLARHKDFLTCFIIS